MRVPFAFLADYAMAHPTDSKMYVIGGGFDTLFTYNFPTAHPQLSVVVRVEFTPAECGRVHTVEIHPVDGDGKPFLPPTSLQVTPQKNLQAPTLPANVTLVLNLVGLQLKQPGDYAFTILVDGQEQESVALHAVKLTPGQLPPGIPQIQPPQQ